MNRIISLLILAIVSVSCFEKETPRPMPHIPGDVTRDQVFIDADYKYQVFYNLRTGIATGRNLKTDWDFAINENQICLNTSKFMTAAKTNESDINMVSSKVGFTFLPDKPSGYLKDLSIGKWEENKVYILDRGYDALGKQLGFAKIKVFTKEGKVFLEYALLANKEAKILEISPKIGLHSTYISIEKGEVSIAPEIDQWHLCFTQYTHVYEDGTPYLVTGVLINRENTNAVEFSDTSFQNINLSEAKNLIYLDSANVIGFDWKVYSFETSSFSTDSERNYLLKINSEYYKLHFLDFYTIVQLCPLLLNL